jgi:hypothetical protein
MRVGVNWAGGGAGKADFGAAGYLAVAGLVLGIILLLIKFTRGFLQNVAVQHRGISFWTMRAPVPPRVSPFAQTGSLGRRPCARSTDQQLRRRDQ